MTDAFGGTDEQFLGVVVNDVPRITAQPMDPSTTGQSLDRGVSLTGGTAPITWSLVGGALPVAGTVDPASGDFSGVAKSARWVENGEVVRPVRETLLSGNAFDLLNGSVTMSDITERVSGSARAPYVLIDGVSVTAG